MGCKPIYFICNPHRYILFVAQGGYTALHKAAGNGHLDVLELLINEGCDIDTQDDMVSFS